MDILPLVIFVALAFMWLKKSEQRKRIALLGRHLGSYQIEKLMGEAKSVLNMKQNFDTEEAEIIEFLGKDEVKAALLRLPS